MNCRVGVILHTKRALHGLYQRILREVIALRVTQFVEDRVRQFEGKILPCPNVPQFPMRFDIEQDGVLIGFQVLALSLRACKLLGREQRCPSSDFRIFHVRQRRPHVDLEVPFPPSDFRSRFPSLVLATSFNASLKRGTSFRNTSETSISRPSRSTNFSGLPVA